MNVGELKELLDDYGDHLPVVVTTEYGSSGPNEKTYYNVEVGSGTDIELNETVVRIEGYKEA